MNKKAMKRNSGMHELYMSVVPQIMDYVAYQRDLRVPTDRNIWNKCLKLQDALIKAGVPSMDCTFDSVQMIIRNNRILKAVMFNRDGTGQPYLFASDKDMVAEIEVLTTKYPVCFLRPFLYLKPPIGRISRCFLGFLPNIF